MPLQDAAQDGAAAPELQPQGGVRDARQRHSQQGAHGKADLWGRGGAGGVRGAARGERAYAWGLLADGVCSEA